LLGLGQSRQQQGCQDSDDGNDDQQFDQGETTPDDTARLGDWESSLGNWLASYIHTRASFYLGTHAIINQA
jgi:hypothetical protein